MPPDEPSYDGHDDQTLLAQAQHSLEQADPGPAGLAHEALLRMLQQYATALADDTLTPTKRDTARRLASYVLATAETGPGENAQTRAVDDGQG